MVHPIALLVLLLVVLLTAPKAGAEELAPATISHDQGGPVDVRGVVTYTNAFFTLGTAAPMVILEDQAGFVDRNRRLYPAGRIADTGPDHLRLLHLTLFLHHLAAHPTSGVLARCRPR